MQLVQVFEQPLSGYWDGQVKTFSWRIDRHYGGKDVKGFFVRVGSWSANHWFNVALGRTDKETLSFARRRLSSIAKKRGLSCTFSYQAD